ncbi:MAG: thiamine pyrophosphate-dependent enzyme [Candidatus Peregrinibacteria bacterium]
MTSVTPPPAPKRFIPNIKAVSQNRQPLSSGHRLCPGCGISVILKQALTTIDNPIITANATGCSEICFGAYPYTSFKTPWIHSLFQNAAAVISGVEAMHTAKLRKGELNEEQKRIKFLAIGGDGATYDIGLQWLSGALERGHDFVYICFDNEGYMNTGYQRSGATPIHTHTTTSPAGTEIHGKKQNRKLLTEIIAAHHIPYIAQASPSNFADLMKKAHRAFEVKGPAFINCLSACPTNWKTDPQMGMTISQRAVDTCFWPLYEVDNGKWKINYKPKEKQPVTEWLKDQGRFKHLLKPESAQLVEDFQKEVDDNWERLLKMEQAFGG